MTQIELARQGVSSEQVAGVAAQSSRLGADLICYITPAEHLALLPENPRAIRGSRNPGDEATCTMCGDFCASRGTGALFAGDLRGDKI